MSGSTSTGRGWTGSMPGADPPAGSPELAPPAPDSGPELAPPDSDEEPLRDDKNQEPAAGGPAGSFTSTGRKRRRNAAQPRPTGRRGGCRESPPRSRRSSGRLASAAGASPISATSCPRTCADTGRLLELYDQAVGQGLALRQRVGPAAVRGGGRACADHRHEEPLRAVRPAGAGRAVAFRDATTTRRRRASGSGGTCTGCCPAGRRAELGAAIRRVPELSEDARLVQAVREVAARAGLRGRSLPAAQA